MTTRHFAALICGAAFLAGAAKADDIDLVAITAPAHKLVEAINHAAKAAPPHVFTKDAVVLDDFAPYHWSGTANGKIWYGELVGATPEAQAAFAEMKAELSVEAPQFARVTGDSAYYVLPAVFQFTDSGKRIRQTGQWVINVKKVKGEWLIDGHAYAITSETEVAQK
jgi:hypothetical protein